MYLLLNSINYFNYLKTPGREDWFAAIKYLKETNLSTLVYVPNWFETSFRYYNRHNKITAKKYQTLDYKVLPELIKNRKVHCVIVRKSEVYEGRIDGKTINLLSTYVFKSININGIGLYCYI